MKLKLLCLLLVLQVVVHAQSNLHKVNQLLDSIFPKNQPGIAIGIVEKGKTIFTKGYGVADLTHPHPITAESNFNIASLTKQFTAAGILYLQEKGKLKLSNTIAQYFPDMNPKMANTVTIEELLTHSSGIVDHYDFVQTTGLKHGYAKQVYEAIKNKDSFYFQPGTAYRYSNTAYSLLGLILEKVSGLSYKDFLTQHFFVPIGMKHTTIWREQQAISNVVTGYDRDSRKGNFETLQAEQHIFFSTEGDGAIYTSVKDYIRWFQSLQKAQILSSLSITESRTIENHISQHQNLGYGYGWFVNKNQYPTYVYHSGDNGGFRTYSFTIPSMDYLVVIFANRSDINIEQVVQQINRILHPELPMIEPIEILTS